jgi:hypothetical protein
MCNCNNNNPCIPNQTLCAPQVDCTCPVRLNSECITYDGDDLECANIESGLPLNQTIKLLDEHVCEAISEINASINLINVGEGEDIFAGIDGIGRRKIKRVNTNSNILTITPNTDDITFGIDEDELTEFVENLIPPPPSPVCIESVDNSVSITQEGGCFNLSVNLTPTEVEIQEGDNITITGTGTNLDPYIISSIDTDTIVTLEDGVTTTINGDGIVVPYSVEIENLQKTIDTFPYTLVDTDDKQTIFIENGASNVVINVPDGLVDNFSAVFIQKGTGTITIQPSGTATLNYPSSVLQNIIKGQYFWAMVEKELTTNTYYLLGSLLPI